MPPQSKGTLVFLCWGCIVAASALEKLDRTGPSASLCLFCIADSASKTFRGRGTYSCMRYRDGRNQELGEAYNRGNRKYADKKTLLDKQL